MILSVCLPWGLLALVEGYRLVERRRRRRTKRAPLRRVFRSTELRELDEHLDRVAEVEQLRIDVALARYVAGVVGHVVLISESRHGVALALSDGGRLALGSINRSTVAALRRRVADDRLYPACVVHGTHSYHLTLRAEAGANMELITPRLALALAP
jgi:hypothetical protein